MTRLSLLLLFVLSLPASAGDAAATDETRAQRAKERAAADEALRQKKAARKAAEHADAGTRDAGSAP